MPVINNPANYYSHKVWSQMQISRSVLHTIKKHMDPEAIIAGGAPRNWVDNVPANDIDLYCRSLHPTTGKIIEQLREILSLDVGSDLEVIFSDDSGEYVDLGFPIRDILEINISGVLFQIIVVDQPTLEAIDVGDFFSSFKDIIIQHMDIGLNKIYVDWKQDSDYRIQSTKHHEFDRVNKTLTLFPEIMTDQQLRHCMEKHLPKMIEYYSRYRIRLGA